MSKETEQLAKNAVAASEGTPEPPFKPVEVAYFLRGSGKGWVRKACRTKRQFDKLMDRLAEEGAEVEFRDLES